MTTAPGRLPSDDTALFQEAVADATPLIQTLTEPAHRHLSPRPIEQPAYLKWPGHPLPPVGESQVGATDELSFARPGVQHRLLQALRRGHLAIDLELDLHGFNAAFAEQLLVEFLQVCRQRRARCVRIIHGKGSHGLEGVPVLKRKVNDWLPRHPEVLAFCSTPRHAGGTGAIFVLLAAPSPTRPISRRR